MSVPYESANLRAGLMCLTMEADYVYIRLIALLSASEVTHCFSIVKFTAPNLRRHNHLLYHTHVSSTCHCAVFSWQYHVNICERRAGSA